MSKFFALRALVSALLSVGLFASTAAPAHAQTAVGEDAVGEDAVDAELVGYTVDTDPLPDSWTDPAVLFGIDPSLLAPLPDFDVAEFHDSTVFATGVDRVATEGDEFEIFAERHIQVLQVIDTLNQSIDTNATDIADLRPQIGRLDQQIDHESAELVRLSDEIDTLTEAITEYAVRTFVSGGEIETFTDFESTASESRVVAEQIREDQYRQLASREAETEQRMRHRADLQHNLRVLANELQELHVDRSTLLENRDEAEEILSHTEASYQLALHDRLSLNVEGTDIPLVALNAYVIAARTLGEERPQCQIQWWMLAGIGKVESFHGHFGDSTLNVNGHTTEAIRGPALDGRILQGGEHIRDGAIAPDPTSRTEAQAVTPAPASAEPPAQQPAAPDAPSEGAEPAGDGNAGDAAPAPVVKRLALIVDSDDGRLDGDTTYDRAVGPMQFIPQTWRLYEADGNLDGNSDPQNIYDAALASGRYLCVATQSMASPAGRREAYFAYNHDTEYSDNVEATGLRYHDQVTVLDEEFGTTSPLGIGDPEWETLIEESATGLNTFDELEQFDW